MRTQQQIKERINEWGDFTKWVAAVANGKDNRYATGLPTLLYEEDYFPPDTNGICVHLYNYLDCRYSDDCSWRQYSRQCYLIALETVEKHWYAKIRDKGLEYKAALECLKAGKNEIESLDKVFTLCHTIQGLLSIAGKTKELARLTVRQEQGGKCIVPNCNKIRQLKLHRCLPGFMGGEYTADNCVLVCAQHHPSLEACRSKAEVLSFVENLLADST